MPPRGQQRAKKFREALDLEVAARAAEGDQRGLRKIARALIDAAEGGDIQAIREFADRLDGKVPQAVVGDDEHDPVSVRTIITGVARTGETVMSEPEPRAEETASPQSCQEQNSA